MTVCGLRDEALGSAEHGGPGVYMFHSLGDRIADVGHYLISIACDRSYRISLLLSEVDESG